MSQNPLELNEPELNEPELNEPELDGAVPDGPVRDGPVLDEVVYDAAERFNLRASLGELWQYREVVASFGLRRLRTRYKQAVFGLGWAVIQPLAFLALFLVFLDGAVGNSEGGAAPAGAYAALVGWQFSSAAIASAGAALVTESSMLRKVFFPREAPVLGAVGAFLPDLASNTVLLLVLAPVLGGPVDRVWLLTPAPYALLGLTALALGLPLAALAVYYRDFLYALPIGIQILLFASPIAYPVERLDPGWRHLYAFLNPLVGPLAGLRNIYGRGRAPDWSLLATSGASTLVLLALGYRLLKALERKMADVV
jgi:lipopolysaccharide transport system permease protein